MNYKDVPAGEYTGRPTKAAAGKAATGNVFVEVEFYIPQVQCSLRWKGYFNTPENTERALRQLDIVGWNCDETFAPGSINTDKLCSLTVNREEYNGRVTPKIAWINDPDVPRAGFGTGDGSALKGLGLKAEMQRFRENKNKAAGQPAPSFDSSEDIPF